jgi:hypothetical protein
LPIECTISINPGADVDALEKAINDRLLQELTQDKIPYTCDGVDLIVQSISKEIDKFDVYRIDVRERDSC